MELAYGHLARSLHTMSPSILEMPRTKGTVDRGTGAQGYEQIGIGPICADRTGSMTIISLIYSTWVHVVCLVYGHEDLYERDTPQSARCRCLRCWRVTGGFAR